MYDAANGVTVKKKFGTGDIMLRDVTLFLHDSLLKNVL